MLRLLLVALLLLAACTNGVAAPEVPEGWTVHDFSAGTLATPPDWTEVEPVGTEVLNLAAPDTATAPGPTLRVRVTERDQAPFDALAQLAFSSFVLQAPDAESQGTREVTVAGAEEATILEVTYNAEMDDGQLAVREQMLIAWFGEDQQLQLRVGAPEDVWAQDRELLERIVATVHLGG